MWSHNSFGMNNSFPNGFNQENFLFPMNTFQNTAGSIESHFPGTEHDALIAIGSSGGKGAPGFEKSSFQSDGKILNQPSFDMNLQTPNLIAQKASRSLSAAQTTNSNSRPSAPQISSRAAELKAQLLARRANPSNSSSGQTGAKSDIDLNVNGAKQEKSHTTKLSHQSPKTPITADKQEQHLNLNDLISQYSESKSKPDLKKDRESNKATSGNSKNQNMAFPKESSEVYIPNNKGISGGRKPVPMSKKKSNAKLNSKDIGRKVDTKLSDPENSEGEIVEMGTPIPKSSNNPKEITGRKIVSKGDERLSRTNSTDLTIHTPQNCSSNEAAAVNRRDSPVPQAIRPSYNDSKRSEDESRPEVKIYPTGPRSDQKLRPHPERKSLVRPEANLDGSQRAETPIQSNRAEPRAESRVEPRSEPRSEPSRQKLSLPMKELRPAAPPTLEDILPSDVDLREWLDITGYHNKTNRDKILGRRRAIAALDAQREKLIAEIEAEERGGIPVAVPAQIPSSSMLPPPIPIPSYKTSVGAAPISTNSSPILNERQQTASNKRPYSSQDSWQENGPGKIARTEKTVYSPRTKDDASFDNRRPRSSGHDNVNRHLTDRHDEPSRPYTNISRDQRMSPGYLAYERKSPARSNGYENDPYDDEETLEAGTRYFEGQGINRGRAFDTKQRSRGRGKSRGDSRDSPEPRGEISSSNFKNSNGRPPKNARGGGNRGSRGNY